MHNQHQYSPPGPTVPPSMPENPPTPPKASKKSALKSALSTVGIFILAPLMALFLTAFVFQSYEVDGPSMENTLQHQDRLIVFKLPKTWARLWNSEYIPSRGDVIVFTKHSSADFAADSNKQLIKRVIGLPGDRVVVKSGEVTVYNSEHPQGYNPDEVQAYADSFVRTSGNVDITIDEGEVFVLGDNRDNSLDSRVFGPVKQTDITGELVLRIYPFNKFDAF